MRVPNRGHPGRRGERGIVLLLTLSVLFISIALVAQLAIGSSVAHASMRNRADVVRMQWASRSAAEEVLNLLRDDAAGGAEGMSAMGSALGANGSGGARGAAGEAGLPGATGAPAGEEGGDGGEGAAEEAAVDSFEDTWAKPMRIMIGDLEITTFVQDENSKYNLHLLAVEDPDRRELEKERVQRILDALREDFDDDLDETESRIIVDEIVKWLDPRARQTELPLNPRHSLGERQDGEFALMSTLEELLLLEHVDESLYYDQVRDEEIAPGLESVFTIWTTIDFADAESGDLDDAEAAAAAAAAAGAGATGSGALPAAAAGDTEVRGEGGLAGALEGSPPIGTKINLNTAPRAVIEGLMPEYRLPRRQTGELLRWRNEVDEEAMDARDQEDVDTEDRELREALFGEDEEDPKQIFKSLEDIRLVPGFEEGALPPDVEQELTDLLGVQSDVFTVYLYARVKQDLDWEPEKRYQEMPGTVLRLRAVVWRRTGQDGPVLLYLQPWQRVPATRWRIPDFQDELPVFRPQRYGN